MGFEVWAPRPASVRLVVDGQTHDMRREGGWWRADVPRRPGQRYGYLLDDRDTPVPDPRSLRQPDGVHELSQVHDLGFDWTDQRWTGRQLAGSVIYEMHVGTFTPDGTLDAAIERLPHLVDLGIDLVEVLPVNSFNGAWNWGYDGVLWYAVDETYGGPEAYQRFVDACHAAGLGVIQDVVYNHLGPSGNYLPLFAPYLQDASANTWGSSLDLAEHEVREYILDNALMWLRDFHVDGLRLDAVHALVDDSSTHLLQEMAERVDALSAHLRRPLTLIAESDMNEPKLITPREGGGYGIHAQWSDDYHHAVHVALTGETSGYYADFEPIEALAKAATRGFFHDGTWSSFREREHGRPIPPETLTWRLVAYAQDHDQIGNRATGDRLSQTLDDDGLAIAALLALAGPFTPMLFMGEEWGASTPWQFFTAHPEPELGEATAKGRIAEFERMGWDPAVVPDPQDPETFRRSKLDWSEPSTGRHARLLRMHRELIALRRREPDLTDPRFDRLSAEWSEDPRWIRIRRGALEIVVNLADLPLAITPPREVLFATKPLGAEADGIPPRSGAIIRP
ncbi:malto-oligosyltrehalose trehalohydrolase [Microbacterium paludicola]|uniref:Malto-oligosyltrehalose trehalohydrolase n=1 Tax=Microbacterium paludicola TaxID=300019 RepID=A0A4Y9FZM4_9MICO|nr:malto-oligosyltrehalose trehalohydrolase [Microbacterium paludicola]MBF0814952.1 malto-oligosyltrehalose trehalohydrolase [Microbacterium paludicola]TFU34678.1 malto-oligosyltrehalose trehalohydrolase [Microbacterium paludicola]